MPAFEMKKVTGKRVKKWFVGKLIASPNIDVRFKFTYSWDMDNQVEVVEIPTGKKSNMSLDRFNIIVDAKVINHKYVLYGKN